MIYDTNGKVNIYPGIFLGYITITKTYPRTIYASQIVSLSKFLSKQDIFFKNR